MIMGCIHAISCCGSCLGCSRYESEQYCGHAEDLYAREMGYENEDDYLRNEYPEEQQEQAGTYDWSDEILKNEK